MSVQEPERLATSTAAAANTTTTTTVEEARPEQAVLGAIIPRVTIQFCTQCKWMLRAAYYAQELLSTFSTALGEVALQPSTGGTFVITIQSQHQTRILWDRKIDGGFPETKELKRRVRDVIEPGRDLGHVDRTHGPREAASETAQNDPGPAIAAGRGDSGGANPTEAAGASGCEDCR